MSTLTLLVILSLATFRITRLIVHDTFPPILWVRRKIQHARPYVASKRDIHQDGLIHDGAVQEYWWLGELVGCVWCTSAYVSGGLVLVTWLLGYSIPLPFIFWFSVWAGGSALAAHV